MDANKFIYIITLDNLRGEHQEKCINMEKTLEEYQTYLRVQYRKKNSITAYYQGAKKFHEHTKGDINPANIQKYLIYLNQTQRVKSIRDNIYTMNRYLTFLHLEQLHMKMPRDKKITRDIITKQQIIDLIDHTRQHYHHQDYLILLMIRDLDARCHEITRMRWGWIYDDIIHFQDCKTGDTNGYISQELHDALTVWRQTTPYPDQPYVFINLHGRHQGRKMSEKGNYIRRLIHKLSLEKINRIINPQDLRSSVISAEFSNYVNPVIIQQKARHRTLETTLKYNHLLDQQTQEYINHGTIFGGYKNSFISTDASLYCTPHHSNLEDDTSSWSFSISFSVLTSFASVFLAGGGVNPSAHTHPAFVLIASEGCTTTAYTSFSISNNPSSSELPQWTCRTHYPDVVVIPESNNSLVQPQTRDINRMDAHYERLVRDNELFCLR